MEKKTYINIEKTWENIAKLMRKSHITKSDLAIIFRISPQAVSQKFNPSSLPTVEQLVQLSNVFEISIEEILVTEMREEEEDEEYQKIINKALKYKKKNCNPTYNLEDFDKDAIVDGKIEEYL